MLALIIQLVSGAVGGNVIAKLLGGLNQGTLINSISGIVGGGLGGQLIGMLTGIDASPSGSLDVGSLIGTVASGGVGGGVVLAVVGFIRNALGK